MTSLLSGVSAGPTAQPQPGNRNQSDPQIPFRTILRRTWPYVGQHRWRLLGAAITVLAAAGLSLVVPAIIRWALDQVMVSSRPVQLWPAAILIVAAGLAEGIAGFGSRYLMEGVGFEVVYRMRAELYRHLHELSFEFHDNARIGDIMSRLTADTEALSRLFGFALPYITANSLTIVGAGIVLALWHPALALSYVLLIPLMVRAMRAYAFTVQPAFRQSQTSLGRLSELLRTVLGGMREIKLFGQEEREAQRVERENQEYLRLNTQVAKIGAYWMPHASFLVGATTAVAIGVGGFEVAAGRATLGTLAAFLSYAAMLTRPIRQTGMLTAAAVRAATAAGRVFGIIDQQATVQELPDAVTLPPLRGEVVLEDVSFAYQDGGPQVLDSINLTVHPGEVMAIVGPTGAGKSTLVHLVPRFYDPQQGRVLIDGHDVREVTLSSLRRQIGTALQSVFLFHGTIRDNIAFGRPEATFAEVEQAAKLAQIHDEITAFPRGYDTPLGERGVSLSGGQRQRLALARVFLTDPRVLILDEISSELDAITESRLREAMGQAFSGRTTIVIAHRLWTIQRADRIVVLDQGKVVQQGTHRELVREEGLYREIYQALTGQTGGETA